MLQATNSALSQNLLVLEGSDAIVALAPLLEDLAARCGQPGAMHWLRYFLDAALLGRRLPRLVVFLRPEVFASERLEAGDLEAAALFFEYVLAGFKTGVVATGDAVGFNSVIGPASQRARVAADASQALVARGAAVVLTTYESSLPDGPSQHRIAPGLHSGWRKRSVGRMLPLRPTLDATLAQLGKSTRFNLRYYRRRLERQIDCHYVPHASSLLGPAELTALNAACLNPVAESELQRRFVAASQLRGSFLCGLRASDGRWLSLIGGWRQGETTVLHWQLNAKGFEKHSIGTVMRSFFLEHEIAQGARNLLIYGGTPHPMRHAFAQEHIADLLVERPGLRTWAVRAAARVVASRTVFRRGNFVAETLASPRSTWKSSVPLTPEIAPGLLKPLRSSHAA